VDDAGGTHYESVWTGPFIKEQLDAGVLRFEKNIRPDHMPSQHPGMRSRRKIEKWATELLEGQAVIGNLSVRLNPNDALYELVFDEDQCQENLVIERGHLDTAVDSESRLKAIMKALSSPMGKKLENHRFAVRIWIADDDLAHKVAANYNTRGDKVNDTAAKWAYQETAGERMARELVDGSRHLGLDNVEVLSNTVSANSHKLAAFNTLAKGIDNYWQGEPLNADQEKEQAAFLVAFWDALATARPEYGRLSKADRAKYRNDSVSGTAVSISGMIAVASAMHHDHIDPTTALAPLAERIQQNGNSIDYFSYDNPIWQKIGVLVQSVDTQQNVHLSLRTSFQSRDAMAAELLRKISLPVPTSLRQK
jgi:hypothetical protein